ncbi:hypothetical protein M0802_014600 [Mischocyttarus mexicanus]|nr:hypothetical protein M0802_014600 [Mischocyttarus mexicanus]
MLHSDELNLNTDLSEFLAILLSYPISDINKLIPPNLIELRKFLNDKKSLEHGIAGDQFYSRYNERILELYKEKYQQDGPSSSTDIGTLPPPTDENIIGEEFFTRLALLHDSISNSEECVYNDSES